MARSTNQRRRTHHRPRPPRQAQRTSTAQGTRNQGTRAWRGGVGSPRGGRWGNGTPNANAAAPKSNGNSAPKLGRASHSLLGADRGRIEPLGNANADPKRRARWGNDQAGTNTGMILARSPIGRGATTFSRWEARSPAPEENGTTHSPRNPTPSRGLLTHSATASSTTSHCVGRVARGLAAKGDSSPVSPTIIMCPFAANPVVASASTLGCKLSYRQRARLRPSV